MKSKIALSLVLSIACVLYLAAATTGTLTLTGVVNGVLDITVTPATVASNLDLTTSQTDLTVATVVEKSNKAAGFTVTLQSANAVAASSATPSLKGSGAVTDSVNYTVKYGGNAVTFANGSAQVTNYSGATGINGLTKVLAISYTGNTGLQEGTYSDTLTLVIAAK